MSDKCLNKIQSILYKFSNKIGPNNHTHIHPFNGHVGTTRVSQYHKGKINLRQ